MSYSVDNIYRTDTCAIDFFKKNGNKNIIFIFYPSKNRFLDGNHHGGDLFLQHGYDVVAIRVNNDDWFQQIPSYVFDAINQEAAKFCYDKRVGYGSSMGGYGVCCFSKILKFDLAVCFCPQFSIIDDFDLRWIVYGKNLDWQYTISDNSINRDCKYIFLYDDKELDALHVLRYKSLISPLKFIEYKVGCVGHSIVEYLYEVNLLKEVALQLVGELPLLNINNKSFKRASKTYYETLAQRFAVKKKFKLSRVFIDFAIRLNSNIAKYHRHRAWILGELGLYFEGVESARIAIQIDPTDASSYILLSNLLVKSGNTMGALDSINIALNLPDKKSECYKNRGWILDLLEDFHGAVESLVMAIELDPADSIAYRDLSKYYLKCGFYTKSLEAIELAINLNPNSVEFVDFKKWLLSVGNF